MSRPKLGLEVRVAGRRACLVLAGVGIVGQLRAEILLEQGELELSRGTMFVRSPIALNETQSNAAERPRR